MKTLWVYVRWFVLMVAIPAAGVFAFVVTLKDYRTVGFALGGVWLFVYAIAANRLSCHSRGASVDYGEYSILIWRVRKTQT